MPSRFSRVCFVGPNVLLVSAKYGLVGLDKPIEPHERLWTRRLALGWAHMLGPELDALLPRYARVGIAVVEVAHEALEYSNELWRAYADRRATRLRSAAELYTWLEVS